MTKNDVAPYFDFEETRARNEYIKEHTPKKGYETSELNRQGFSRNYDKSPIDSQLGENVARRAIASTEANADADRAIAMAEAVFKRLNQETFNNNKTKNRELVAWATKMVAGFEAAESTADEQGQADVELRTAQAEFLARWYNQCHGENLNGVLEGLAARIYGQDQDPQTYLQQTGAKERGFIFEEVSRAIPVRSSDVDTYYPDLGRPKIEGALAKTELEDAKVMSVNSLKLPRKAAIIGWEVTNAVGRENAKKMEFDPTRREWVAKGDVDATLVTRANKVNTETNARLTVPDNLITKNGKIVGFVEVKCWQEPELVAFVELLSEQTRAAELSARNLGGRVLNDLNLQLKLQNERDYLAAAANLNETEKKNLLAVIRLPANISPELITKLRFELERRHERVVIEQIRALTADETELVATSLIDLDFAKREEERFAKTTNPDRNLRARALALGVRLEDLEKPQVTSILEESGVVLEDVFDPNHVDEIPTEPVLKDRVALIQKLAADYQQTKRG